MREQHHSPDYASGTGNFRHSYHLEMVLDITRVEKIKEAIDYYRSNTRRFLELGSGSGLFLKYASPRFHTVVGVEQDLTIAQVAKSALQNELAGNVRLHEGSAFEVQLGEERFDVILCEMLSTWMITEPQVPVVREARQRFLAPGGVLIPRRVVNLAELGHFPFGNDLVQIPSPITQFTGVRSPSVITTSEIASSLEFTDGELPDRMEASIRFVALMDGIVNCVRLSSIVDLAPKVCFFSTDTLMPYTIIPLQKPIEVARDQQILLRYRYTHRSELSKAVFWVDI